MWKQILALGRQLLALGREVEKHEEIIQELQESRREDRQAIRDLNAKVSHLTEILQNVAVTVRHREDSAASERKMLLLEVENLILRSGTALPPRSDSANSLGGEEPPE